MDDRYEFDCPRCAARFEVDAGVRRRLLEFGCVVCGDSLSKTAFARTVRPESGDR